MGFWAVAGPIIASAAGALISSQASKSSSDKAAKAQKAATQTEIGEAQRQFDTEMAEYIRKQERLEQIHDQQLQLLTPYIQAGQGALFEMMALSGMAAPASPVAINKQPAPIQMSQDSSGQFRAIPAARTPTTPGTIGILSGGARPVSDLIGKIGGPIAPIGTTRTSVVTPEAKGAFTSSGPMGMVRDLGKFIGTKVVEPEYKAVKQDIAARTIPQAASPYAGMTGEEAQAAAIEKIAQSPLLAELTRQGEEAILQRSAATGGLRGGNIQGALAQFRPAMLQAEIDKQFARLSGFSSLGQQSILSTPTQQPGTVPTSGVGSLYGDLGTIEAQRQLAAGKSQADLINEITKGVSAGIGAYYNQPQQKTTVWSGTA